jgi:hypothetical protein
MGSYTRSPSCMAIRIANSGTLSANVALCGTRPTARSALWSDSHSKGPQLPRQSLQHPLRCLLRDRQLLIVGRLRIR